MQSLSAKAQKMGQILCGKDTFLQIWSYMAMVRVAVHKSRRIARFYISLHFGNLWF